MTTADKKNDIQQKYFNFILDEYRLLVTSLTPEQTFLQEGKIDIQDVELIINEALPKEPRRYADRVSKRSSSVNKNKKGIAVSLVESPEEIEKIQE